MKSNPSRHPSSLRIVLAGMIGLLLICSSEAYSQSSTRGESSTRGGPGEWTSLVAPPIPEASATVTSSAFSNPLKDLRQPDPSGLLQEDLGVERVLGNTTYSSQQYRSEPTLVVGWGQPELRHRQLYFQDDQIERGTTKRQFPNITAGAKFFKSVLEFPVRLVLGK